jgi:hypothetical protein
MRSLAPMVDPHQIANSLRPIYTQLIADLNLPPTERYGSTELKNAVLEYAEKVGVPYPKGSKSYQALLVGFSYVDVSSSWYEMVYC